MRGALSIEHARHAPRSAGDPTFEPAYNNRGLALLALGDLRAAEADFRRAIDLYPDAEMALANLASVYYNTGRPAAARPLLRRALDLAPANEGYRRMWDALEEPAAGHLGGTVDSRQ